MKKLFSLGALFVAAATQAQTVWTPDLGNGKYKNPVLYADYSDPDVIRVGDDYWLTASSFNHMPGLPILHSTDLVNWELVNTVFLHQEPLETFDKVTPGEGVWAPAIRYHNGEYYIYWGNPYEGVYMTKTTDPRGEWSKPHLVKKAEGIIDTCPLWDEDGRAYLVHGWAGSCAGFKSVLSVTEMTPDGKSLFGDEVMIFDGHDAHPTVEGPKFYKRNGRYYVFAPAGGVKPGWQIVLRSRSPFGPYECRTVLHQGDTDIPGPHQGGWVDDVNGDCWFMHFVDMYAYGRVVHLQPMTWSDDDWCLIGIDRNGDGIGEPVHTYRKPAGKSEVKTPVDNDEFSDRRLGIQWQWPANPQTGWYFTNPTDGEVRLYCKHFDGVQSLWKVPNLLLQKVNAPNYTVTTKVSFRGAYEGDRAGLVMMGRSYATLGFEYRGGKVYLTQEECIGADKGKTAVRNSEVELESGEAWLRCRIELQKNDDGTPRMLCNFSYSTDGKKFKPLGKSFVGREGHWIGAKIGYYATAEIVKNDGGWLDIDWFRTSAK